MRTTLKNIADSTSSLLHGLKNKNLYRKSFWLPFLFSFLLLSGFIEITLIRSAAIRTIKSEIAQTSKYLRSLQLDFAYDKITFDAMFFRPLVKIENLQIYNLRGHNLWNINFAELSGNTGLFNSEKIKFVAAPALAFTFNKKKYTAEADTSVKFYTDKSGKFKKLYLHFDDAEIKNFAKVKSIKYHLKNLPVLDNDALIMPSLESSLEIRDITLNGLLKYPLTSKIQRMYLKAQLMSKITLQDDVYLSIENWLHNDGFIDIADLLINWEPLVLAGRGTIRFSEKMEPRLNLTTSSKAILQLLNDLQKNNFLNRTDVFVADILLNNKAFKLRQDDKHLTVTTPITYRDGKLAIENITVKDFTPQSKK